MQACRTASTMQLETKISSSLSRTTSSDLTHRPLRMEKTCPKKPNIKSTTTDSNKLTWSIKTMRNSQRGADAGQAVVEQRSGHIEATVIFRLRIERKIT